jgi:hypothetical protein
VVPPGQLRHQDMVPTDLLGLRQDYHAPAAHGEFTATTGRSTNSEAAGVFTVWGVASSVPAGSTPDPKPVEEE